MVCQTSYVYSVRDGGILFEWRNEDIHEQKGYTVWGTFKESTAYFQPSPKEFKINLRVENLEALLDELKEEGVQVVGEIEKYEYGKFGWIMDLEGNKTELWEPADSEFTKMYEGRTIH